MLVGWVIRVIFTFKHIDELRLKPIFSRNFPHRDSKPTKTAFYTDSKSLSNHSKFKSSICKRVLHLVSIIFLAVSWGGCTTSQYFPRSPNLLSSARWWESHLNLCLEFGCGNPKGISHLPMWWCNLLVAGWLNLRMEKYQQIKNEIVKNGVTYPFQTTRSWCPC